MKMRIALLMVLSPVLLPLGAETADGIFLQEKETAATPVWREALAGAVTGLPAIQAGSVVVVLDGGHIRSYTLEGKSLWDYYANGKLTPYVTRSREGTNYISKLDGTLIAVNRAGRELWQLKPGTITSQIISGWDGRIFVPVEKKSFCYTASGYLLWSQELGSDPVLGPMPDKQGGLVLVQKNGDLTEINHFGNVKIRALGEVPSSIIPLNEGKILVAYKNSEIRLLNPPGEIQGKVFGRNTGTALPKLRGVPVAGTSLGNRAALLLSNGKLVELSLPNGKQIWTGDSHLGNNEISQGSKDKVNLIYDERGVYVFSRTGGTAWRADGRRLWLLRIQGAESIPAMGDNGILYSGGSDWILYAYKLEDRALPGKQSIYGPEPEGTYGLGNPPPSPWAEDFVRYDDAQLDSLFSEIAVTIQDGKLGENEAAYTAYLMEISGCARNPKASETHPPVHVKHRVEAVRLLGYIGSRETIPFLADLFDKDPDAVVKATAAEAIGRIGVDPDGYAIRAYSKAITATARDERILTAVASSIGNLCRFSGPPLSESGVKLLAILERDFMPAKARAQARRETASLR